MSKRKLLLILLAFLCTILAVSYLSYYNLGKKTESQPQDNPPETLEQPPEIPEEPQFVIPESPIGTLGPASALAAAFGIFAIAKRRKSAPVFLS